MLNQHKQLQGKLQNLQTWVGDTILILNSKECSSETDADSLNQCLQQCEVKFAPILKLLSFELSILFSCHRNQYIPFLENLIFHFRDNEVCYVLYFRLSYLWHFSHYDYFSFQLFSERVCRMAYYYQWLLYN